ncbi:hypothetical protein ACLK2I_22230 [Escherichia coli]
MLDFSQLFTQFHAPLVEGEDVQDHALSKDFVSYSAINAPRLNGVISRQQDGVSRAVTFEHFERRISVTRSLP